jgi:hypothetical protein
MRRRSRIELLSESPAAAGGTGQMVFRAALVMEGVGVAARALDTLLRQA